MSDIFGISVEDLNGECFVVGAEGEREEKIDTNEVVFPHNMPAGDDATPGQNVDIEQNMANLFIYANVKQSVSAGRNPADAAKIAYVRFLAARQGLMSPHFSVSAHHVRYNNSVFLTKGATDAHQANLAKVGAEADPVVAQIREALSSDVRSKLRKNFANIVCCVAYVFRVRGHHYRDDFNTRYASLWSRCLVRPDDNPLSWELCATDALHAIMPDVLDLFWGTCVMQSRCAGALIKRYDSAPAGVAGIVALKRGLDDVRIIFPTIINNVPEAFDEFNRVLKLVVESRWGGSVNARYYGATRIRINEGSVGVLASVVMGVYEQLASESKLRESPALQRLAQTAPATGGAIGLAARRTVQSDRMLLIEATAQVEAPK